MSSCAVTEPLDEPLAVVGVGEGCDGLAEVVDVAVSRARRHCSFSVQIQRGMQQLLSGSPGYAGSSVMPNQCSEPVKCWERY